MRRWRGRKLESASLICLEASDVSTKKRLDVPEYTRLCGEIQMDWHRCYLEVVLHASIATARVQCTCTVAALVPRAAGAKVGDARYRDRYHCRYHYRFRDLGLPYLCAAHLYRCRLMDEDPIREIDKEVHIDVLQGTWTAVSLHSQLFQARGASSCLLLRSRP